MKFTRRPLTAAISHRNNQAGAGDRRTPETPLA